MLQRHLPPISLSGQVWSSCLPRKEEIGGSNPSWETKMKISGCSSVDRVPALEPGSRGFEPHHPDQIE